MGRWSYSTRGTTDEYRSISMQSLRRHNYINRYCSGVLTWGRGDAKSASVKLSVTRNGDKRYLHFEYTYTNRQKDKNTELDYYVQLESTPCYFGGKRWWFTCPASVNGKYCGRRVGVLYWAGKYFACRHCYKLVYESSRKHRSFYEGLSKRFEISDKYKKICAGKGRKGFSKRELSQIAKLERKVMSLPEFPPKPVIVYKSQKKAKRR